MWKFQEGNLCSTFLGRQVCEGLSGPSVHVIWKHFNGDPTITTVTVSQTLTTFIELAAAL